MTADVRPADRVAERRDFGLVVDGYWPTIVWSYVDGYRAAVRFQRVWVGADRARYIADDGTTLDIWQDDVATVTA